jgi:hypothetical protein
MEGYGVGGRIGRGRDGGRGEVRVRGPKSVLNCLELITHS